MRKELREWLGLTWADLIVYLGAGALIGMYFHRGVRADVVLAIVGVVLLLIACPLGMRQDPELSRAANAVKRWAYPACVAAGVFAVVYHFAWL